MTTYSIKAPDGQTYQIDGPEGASQEQVQAEVMRQHPHLGAPVAEPTKPRTFADTLGDIGDAGKRYVSGYASGIGNATSNWAHSFSVNPLKNAAGTGEAGLNIATGILSNPLALAARLSGNTRPTEDIQKDLTYQPRSDIGQAIVQGTGAITKPINDIGEIGAKGLSAVTPMTPGTASALINTGLLATGIRGIKASPIISAAEAAQRAQNYVRTNTSLDWTALPDAMRARLADLAKNQKNLEALDPKAIERQVQLESLPVPITNASKGQLARDPRQLQQEELLKSTDAGQVLTQDALAQNRALMQNLDILQGRTAGTARGATETGRMLQDQTLRPRLAQAEKGINSLYAQARSTGETLQPVDITPLKEWFEEPSNKLNAPYIGKLIDAYSKNPKAAMDAFNAEMQKLPESFDHDGPGGQKYAQQYADIKANLARIGDKDVVSVNDLERIRQNANTQTQSADGATRHFAGEAIKTIDSMLDQAGGNIYQQARSATRAMHTEFGDQSAVARLVENKSRTDRQTALEDTYHRTVISGSLEDLQKVKASLQNSPGGTQALRDLAAQTVHNIKEAASKGASNQAGEVNATYNNLSKAINAIGYEKLTVLIGKQSTQQLRNILQAAETLKTEPTGINVRGSNTVNKLMNILDKTLITKIPIIGDLTGGAIKGVAKLHEMGRAGREVRSAQQQAIPKVNPNLMTAEELAAYRKKVLIESLSLPVTNKNRSLAESLGVQ